MSEKAKFVGSQAGACGVSCSLCPVSKHEKYRCFGCEWLNKMLKKARENKKGCMFWECAQDKKVECCFTCEKFPCEKHYDSEEAIYTKQILDIWKELRRTGLAFWGKRKELESLLEAEENRSDK